MIKYELIDLDSCCDGPALSCVPDAETGVPIDDLTVEIAYLKATISDLKAELEQARSDLADAYDQGWDAALDPPRCTVTDLDTKGNGCGECGDCTPPNPYRKVAS